MGDGLIYGSEPGSPADTHRTIVIHASVPRALGQMLLWLALFSFALLSLRDDLVGAWKVGLYILLLSLTGGMAIRSGIKLFPDSDWLGLSPDGITICRAFKEFFIPWKAIREFSTGYFGRNSTPSLFYDLSDDSLKPALFRKSFFLQDHDGFIPTHGFGLRREELTLKIETYWRVYNSQENHSAEA